MSPIHCLYCSLTFTPFLLGLAPQNSWSNFQYPPELLMSVVDVSNCFELPLIYRTSKRVVEDEQWGAWEDRRILSPFNQLVCPLTTHFPLIQGKIKTKARALTINVNSLKQFNCRIQAVPQGSSWLIAEWKVQSNATGGWNHCKLQWSQETVERCICLSGDKERGISEKSKERIKKVQR